MMQSNRRLLIAITTGTSFALLTAAQAGWFRPPRYTQDNAERHARAGCPTQILRWARPSDEPNDVGYYVGGGRAYGGDGPCLDEGTWGWDYETMLARVQLGWWHGQRYQGGTGQYEPGRLLLPRSNHAY